MHTRAPRPRTATREEVKLTSEAWCTERSLLQEGSVSRICKFVITYCPASGELVEIYRNENRNKSDKIVSPILPGFSTPRSIRPCSRSSSLYRRCEPIFRFFHQKSMLYVKQAPTKYLPSINIYGGKSVGKERKESEETERNSSPVHTRQLKDARNEPRELTWNAWILCSVNEPPLRRDSTLSFSSPCERHGRFDSSSFLLCVRFRYVKKEFTLRTFRAVWNFSTSGRKRPRESLEDISVGSRASGLRNDRWARVFSPVSEKVSFFSPPRYRRMCEVIFHFLRAPSVIDHFFSPSMIDKIIIIIIVVVIVAIRTRITNFSDLYWIIRR